MPLSVRPQLPVRRSLHNPGAPIAGTIRHGNRRHHPPWTRQAPPATERPDGRTAVHINRPVPPLPGTGTGTGTDTDTDTDTDRRSCGIRTTNLGTQLRSRTAAAVPGTAGIRSSLATSRPPDDGRTA
ncbi:hypothetical protein Ait01nite_000010 [Actinoplanes italicus]|nr:hypothetical protein Ait01nite_000010 [Actinoplanes italicus]